MEQADRQTDGQDHVLSQADALTKNSPTGAVVRASPSYESEANWNRQTDRWTDGQN